MKKLLLAVTLFVLMLAPCEAAVTVLAGSAALGENGAATSRNDTFTTVSGTNTALVCELGFSGDPGAFTAATFNSVNMTQIGSTVGSSSAGFVALFGLVNPSIGTNEPTHVAWTNSVNSTFQCTEFGGANQTGGTTTFANFNSATGTSSAPAVTITTTSGDGVADSSTNKFHGFSSVSPTTLQAAVNGAATAYAASNGVSSGTSVAITWSLSGSSTWIDAGVDVTQAGGAAASAHNLMLLGVGN